MSISVEETVVDADPLVAFVMAYDEWRHAEHELLALGSYVAPNEEMVRERRERFLAASVVLDKARKQLRAADVVLLEAL